MYLGFYKLKEMPFRLAPDPRFTYLSAGHAAALAAVHAVQKPPAGCAILIGARGTGKTGLLEYLRQEVPPQRVSRIDFPPRTLAQFTDWLHEDGEPDAPRERFLLLCDNAHLFPEAMLLALLRWKFLPDAGLAAPTPCVVLAGEPELAQVLESPELGRLCERNCQRIHLPPLTATELPAYINHRLGVAGASGARIFRDAACAEVHRETKGNPRLVNALCDSALVIACERELPEVGSGEIHRALDDLGRLVALQAEDRAATGPQVRSDEPPAADGESRFSRLRLTHGTRLVLERELTRGILTIGRNPDNDLPIESKFVSRHHCRIVTSEQRCIVEDVHSTNGLFVNDRRVRRHRLRDGDVVLIGEHRLHYVDLRADSP